MLAPLVGCLLGVALLLCGSTAFAQGPENVAVVINDNSAASQLVGTYYSRQRSLPPENVIRIRAATDETIDRNAYAATIERPIAAALARRGLQDRVLYIVLTKGVPLRVAGTLGVEGTMSSVDSELTLLYRRMTGQAIAVPGRIDNPYFIGSGGFDAARRFSHREHDIYLVSRLDAFTPDEAIALVDAASAPSQAGRVLLDQRAALTNTTGDEWLSTAADALRAAGHEDRVRLDTTPQPVAEEAPVLGYASWGATDPALQRRRAGLTFAPGAIAMTLTGADARTFTSPPETWRPMSDPQDRRTWFGGSPQSLIGDLIREGVTGVAGGVAEPFLQGVPRPEILFPAYLSGFNLVESFYLAMPYLSWQTVVIGDPLCAPFTRQRVPAADADPAPERSTSLPRFFSERRMEAATAISKAAPAVVTLLVRAEAQLARGETAEGERTLEEALDADATLVGPRLQLALMAEASEDYDSAIVHYRRILELQPDNAAVLNNLAYTLAARKDDPAAARPLAQRAVDLSRRNATIVDTLGWIEYLLGNLTAASALIDEAIKGAPGSGEIRLHGAFVAAGLKQKARADGHLREALRRAPALAERDDVEALRAQIAALPAPGGR